MGVTCNSKNTVWSFISLDICTWYALCISYPSSSPIYENWLFILDFLQTSPYAFSNLSVFMTHTGYCLAYLPPLSPPMLKQILVIPHSTFTGCRLRIGLRIHYQLISNDMQATFAIRPTTLHHSQDTNCIVFCVNGVPWSCATQAHSFSIPVTSLEYSSFFSM